MSKYRGFMNEVSSDGLGWHGLGAGFQGPRVAYAPPPVATQTPYRTIPAPPVVQVPVTIMPIPRGTPGDIRDVIGRSQPGEAIEDVADDMTAENGVPGVDNGGAFPYGDPRAAEKAVTKTTPGNQGLVIAAILAALFLGG